LARLGVDVRLDRPANADAVLSESPDIVVIATGGTPRPPACPGADLTVSSWKILAGETPPGSNVLVYDEPGLQGGVSAADYLATRGAEVELVTPDRLVGEAIGHTGFVAHLRNLYKHSVIQTPNLRLTSVYAEGNSIIAVLRNEFTNTEEERSVDQIVYDLGTLPRDELYHELRPSSRNLGEVDYDRLIGGLAQDLAANPAGSFQLFRIGDAIMSRNVHAAIYDASRLMKDL
jgi:dimethylglycine catabolism A